MRCRRTAAVEGEAQPEVEGSEALLGSGGGGQRPQAPPPQQLQLLMRSWEHIPQAWAAAGADPRFRSKWRDCERHLRVGGYLG